ncbi:MAG: 30S ribosomal protein S17e [archaeon]|nr:30S ribosomal protein S17e [archaeon]
MGRIKSTLIKKAARQLLEGDHKFNEHFERNKKVLVEGMPSKSMRNKIAGYIGRLVRMKKAEIAAANNPKKVSKVVEEIPQYEQ